MSDLRLSNTIDLSDAKINAAVASSVIGLTRHVMEVDHVSEDVAYRTVYQSELYKLLGNAATRLFLVPNADLVRLFDVERQGGAEVLYAEAANGL